MARIIINCGVVPVKSGGMEDGIITFGKHAGSKLSDDAVTWRYLAWAYAWLENNRLPPQLSHVLELVWYWGQRKFDEDYGHDEDGKDFDELLDEARMGMDQDFRGDPAYRETGRQMTYDYDEQKDEWFVTSVAEKRRKEREVARDRAAMVVAETARGEGDGS